MFIVDTLSRAHLPLSDHVSQNELKFIQSVEEIDMTRHLAVTRERLADFQGKTKNDAVLHQLKQAIELGWPESRKAVPSEICAFYTYWNKLTVQDEILSRGDRVIVPAAIRLEMLRKIHARHIGIEGCLRWARGILYWCGMSAAVRDCLCSQNMQFISHGTTQRAPRATESTQQALVKGCCGSIYTG